MTVIIWNSRKDKAIWTIIRAVFPRGQDRGIGLTTKALEGNLGADCVDGYMIVHIYQSSLKCILLKSNFYYI